MSAIEDGLRVGVASGDSGAMVRLADFLAEQHAYDEVPADEIRELLERAAGRGHSEAAFVLGAFLRAWDEPEEAEPWLRRAADGGHAEAWAELGHLFDGEGDPDEAVRCYRRAAELGSRQGAENLAVLEAELR